MKITYSTFCKKTCILATLLATFTVQAGNPIIANQGVNDPHIKIFEGKAYLYATHDKSAENTTFVMEDWWVWSSPNLVDWTLESVLDPADTYIGEDFGSAWATDAAYKDGKYYWYFSEANEQTGVVVGDSPVGPWKDVLKAPLLTADMTPTHEYDPAVFKDTDGQHYIIFGVWDYHIAKLGDDMMSLAEAPKKITVNNARGPYTDLKEGNFAGTKTDDKPFVHYYNGKYYLSWGAFYAVADNLYGPYNYVDKIVNEQSFTPETIAPTWPVGYFQGRHGSFFEWHDQWYFAYCDISQTGNRYFRDTFISYVHYRDDGTIAPIKVDLIGVGNYDAKQGIEAEEYFSIQNAKKVQLTNGKDEFGVVFAANETGTLHFPKVKELVSNSSIALTFTKAITHPLKIEVALQTDTTSQAKDKVSIAYTIDEQSPTITVILPKHSGIAQGDSDLTLSFTTKDQALNLDKISFK